MHFEKLAMKAIFAVTNASYTTDGPSYSCEMIILQNKSPGEIVRVFMGIFTTALRNKNKSNSQ